MTDEWISIGDAARLAKRNAGHLRKLCKNGWEARGLAELRAVNGKRPTWYIHASALRGEQAELPHGSTPDSDLLRRVVTGIATLERAALMRVWALVQAEQHTARITPDRSMIETSSKGIRKSLRTTI